MAANKWILLVKKFYQEVKGEGKLKGPEALKEAIRRAKQVWISSKNR